MCLYLPEQEIAIEITDDEQSQPFDPGAFPGIRLIRLTKAQMARLISGNGDADVPQGDYRGSQAAAWKRMTSHLKDG